jgi:glutamine synthetase
MRAAFGGEFCDAYVKLKTHDWNKYCQQLTPWERDTTLDC